MLTSFCCSCLIGIPIFFGFIYNLVNFIFIHFRLELELTRSKVDFPISLLDQTSSFMADTFECVLTTCTTCLTCGYTSRYQAPGTKYTRLQVWPTLDRLQDEQRQQKNR
jgi:hypothetical protein